METEERKTLGWEAHITRGTRHSGSERRPLNMFFFFGYKTATEHVLDQRAAQNSINIEFHEIKMSSVKKKRNKNVLLIIFFNTTPSVLYIRRFLRKILFFYL